MIGKWRPVELLLGHPAISRECVALVVRDKVERESLRYFSDLEMNIWVGKR